ncbi:MAG: NADH-quinone oxidoreductase subunit A [Candidatus Bathyarchaeia archaeon]
MMEDFIVALVAIFMFSITIYVSGVALSRRSVRNEPSKKIPYVCGERPASLTSRVVVSLYKYVIFFIILDSSLVIIAFASTALNPFNIWFFSIYVLLLLISSTLLMEVVE